MQERDSCSRDWRNYGLSLIHISIFYHANDMVKAWTGYDYSVRDHKTRYFARQYARAVKQITTPEGVLFLSERQVDAGGNLDWVRSLLQKEGKTELKEFLTTKTVDKRCV